MLRPGRHGVLAVVVLGGIMSTVCPLLRTAHAAPSPGGADLCARFGPVVVAGNVAPPALVELSGLAASRAHPGVLWAHNDSGAEPALDALDATGVDLGTYAVSGARAVDWEDIAVGPGPANSGIEGDSFIYVADIGDNAGNREDLVVYRMPEPGTAPDGSGGSLGDVAPLALRYPDGPADAETLLVDPRSGELVIVTKSLAGESHVLTAPGDAWAADPATTVVLTDVGVIHIDADFSLPGLPGSMVTGGDISPDGSIVLLRTYQYVLAFARADGQSIAEALLGAPCHAPAATEPQGEAIAFSADGGAYFTSTEVQRAIADGALPAGSPAVLSRVDIASIPSATTTVTTTVTTTTTAPTTTTTAPTTTATTTTTAPTSAGTTAAAPTTTRANDAGRARWSWMSVPLVLFAVAAVAMLWWIRRRGLPRARRSGPPTG